MGSTKNIDYIGARTLFISCNCNNKYLMPVRPIDADKKELEIAHKIKKRIALDKYISENSESLGTIFKQLKKEGTYSFDHLKKIIKTERDRCNAKFNNLTIRRIEKWNH